MDYDNSSVYYDYRIDYQSSYEESYYFDHGKAEFITDTLMWAICIISLPLNGAVISATFSQVQKDVTRIYVMNLLVSDLLQLFSVMAQLTIYYWSFISYGVFFGLMVSVGFRMCVALERCSVVFCPQGSCCRQSVNVCAVVCFFVWLVPFCFFISFIVLGPVEPLQTATAIFLLLPCPFLIFVLGVSLKSLCGANSVSPNVKPRVVGSVVLLVLVHMLLILPFAISILPGATANFIMNYVLSVTLRLSPLADMFLYFFLTKRNTNNLGTSVNRSVMNDESSNINSSV